MTDRTATDWAWDQVSSMNLQFEPTEALVLLAAAHLADHALDEPNGYSATSGEALGRALPRVEFGDLVVALRALQAAGLLRSENGGYRVPEEAFGNGPRHPCERCSREAAFVVALKGAPNARPLDLCGPCAAQDVERGQTEKVVSGLLIWRDVG